MQMDLYDRVAPHYRELAEQRTHYLAAVDRFVLEHAPQGAKSVLDVGAADGVRGMALARALGIDDVVLCEPSREMASRCERLSPREVWQCSAEELSHASARFDIVLCLWNVLGHVRPGEARIRALANMRSLLAPGGAVFLDVNNRHNAAAYGAPRVFGRVILDAIDPKERRGDSSFVWNVGGERIPATGHLFTAREVADLVGRAGLVVEQRASIDYLTGASSRWFFRGQLVYKLADRRH